MIFAIGGGGLVAKSMGFPKQEYYSVKCLPQKMFMSKTTLSRYLYCEI